MYESWVRYSVAVYLGLLMAGTAVGPSPAQTNGSVSLRTQESEFRIQNMDSDFFSRDRQSLGIADSDRIPLRY